MAFGQGFDSPLIHDSTFSKENQDHSILVFFIAVLFMMPLSVMDLVQGSLLNPPGAAPPQEGNSEPGSAGSS